jgi:MFS family permease
MFRYDAFRAGIMGGSLFRLGIGAMPFLLPLMLQLGFGLSPFESGMVTFVGAVGALGSKFFVNRIYATFGFRRVFVVGTFVSSCLIGVNGLFFPGSPLGLMMACLLAGGVLRSLTFTGINAMIFSDIDDADTSQATAINSVAQQISMALGVAIAGAILDVSALTHGGELNVEDFHIAFFVVALMAVTSCINFIRMPANTGAEVTGHRAPAMVKH